MQVAKNTVATFVLCLLVGNQSIGMDTGSSSQLPDVSWEFVGPSTILPIVSLPTSELRKRFSDPESTTTLLNALTHKNDWVAAHVTLTALYPPRRIYFTPQFAFSTVSKYEKGQRIYDVKYAALAVNIRYIDDGFCVRKVVDYPYADDQRLLLKDKWEQRLIEFGRDIIQDGEGYMRTRRQRYASRLDFEVNVSDDDLDALRRVLCDDVRWVARGIGSPEAEVPGSLLEQFDDGILIRGLAKLLDEDQYVAHAHLVLTYLIERNAYRMTNKERHYYLNVNGLTVHLQSQSGGGFVAEFPNIDAEKHEIRALWWGWLEEVERRKSSKDGSI